MRGRVLTATERTAARRSERGPPLELLSAGPAQPLGDSVMGSHGIEADHLNLTKAWGFR